MIIAASLLMIEGRAAGEKRPCGLLERKGPQQILAYLQGERAALDSACIVYAIDSLGQRRYAPAADTLTSYLDFRRPGTENKDREIIVVRIPWLGDKYPAATALFEIGKAVVPSLVRAIGDGDRSAE
jgi:hypothetical protein